LRAPPPHFSLENPGLSPVKITYHSWLGEELGCSEEEVTLPPQVRTVGALINWLSTRSARYEAAFEFVEVVKVVVNQAYADDDHPVTDEDEILLMPPIAGG